MFNIIKKIIIENRVLFFIIILVFIINLYRIIEYHEHTYIIDNYRSENYKKYDYIGYIEINSLNIKREIVLGINDECLKTHVCLSTSSTNLESDNIILAGHSRENIFLNLHKIKIGETIKISSFDFDSYYEVTDILEISKYDIEQIDKSNLILITCMINNNQRLIIKAKRKR